MIYIRNARISHKEMETSNIPKLNERIFRDLAHGIISDMPLEDLEKVFRFTSIDPFSEESDIKLYNPDTPEQQKKEIIEARNAFQYFQDFIHYKATIYVYDK